MLRPNLPPETAVEREGRMRVLRIVLMAVCGALSLVAAGPAGAADAYPSRPVHWIVGYPPGGSTDILARIMGQWLSERLHQQFIVDNRPGAGNNIGTEVVVKAP